MPKTATTGVKQAQRASVEYDTQSIHLKPGNQKSLRAQVQSAYTRICKGVPTRKKNFNWLFKNK